MALNTRLSIAARNAQLDALAPLADGGYLRLYNGSQPASPDVALSGQTQLAELRFGSPAFGAASAGVLTANALTDDSDADATGTATWFRVYKSDGTTPLWDGSVGTSGANLNMNSAQIQIHARVSISSLTHSLPMQGS